MSNKNSLKSINGILLYDKEAGISSNSCLQKLKKQFKAKKAGHTGTLDPLASGMLPICFGEATKFASFLLEADKVYEVTAKLGIETTTYDSCGEIINIRTFSPFTDVEIKKAIINFTGLISQIPPIYSAIKQSGKRLYELARSGKSVEILPREVKIFSFELIKNLGSTVSFKIHCSKGTYIRSLIHDLGQTLGCGAHVIALRRLKVGHLTGDMLIDGNTLISGNVEDYLLPMDYLLSNRPKICLPMDLIIKLQQGQKINYSGNEETGVYCLYDTAESFYGLINLLPERIFIAKRMLTPL